MTSILVIGSGARESIIIKKINDDSIKLDESISIICVPTQENSSINKYCSKLYPLESTATKTLSQITETIQFCIIGPEAPLQLQYADYLENKNIPCIGPLQIYAQLETSKQFCRDFLMSDNFLKNYSPKFKIIDQINKTRENITYILNEFDEIVIKKDGLCGGKGVTVQGIDFTDKYSQIDYILNSILKIKL